MGCYLDTYLVVQCKWLLYCNVNNVSYNIVYKKVGSEDTVLLL